MKSLILGSLVFFVLALSPEFSARAGLIGFYSFDDEGNPFVDDSGNGYDLESYGADPVHTMDGGFTGGGMNFNGAQRLIAPLSIFWDEENLPQLTMGAWVRTSTLNSGLRKFIGCDDGAYDRVIGLDNRQATGFGYTAFTGVGVMGGGPVPVSTEQWTFVAVTYDQTAGEAVLYVGLDASTVAPLTVATAATGFGTSSQFTTSIGSLRSDSNAEGWVGDIDNVFFYDEVLSEAQLTAIRNGGKATILGVGGSDPGLSITAGPDLRALGKGPAEHAFSFAIKNPGVVNTLTISGVTLAGADASHYTVVRFPATLAPGADDTIDFKLTPNGQVGTFAATATVASTDPSNPTLTLDLGATVLGTSLLGVYTFDDPENPLKDDSGQGRTLQTVEGVEPLYEADGGVAGGAYYFDGTQRLVAPVNIRFDATPFLTMGAWVKPSSVDSGYRKFIGNDAGWSRVMGLDPRGANGFRYTAFMGSGVLDQPSPPPVNTDDWNFLAVSYAQPLNTMTLYVDLEAQGDPGAFAAYTGPATINSGTATTSLGSLAPASAGEGWEGHIDTVFFVKGRLEEEAVKAIRDGGRNALLALQPDPVLFAPETSVFGSADVLGARTVSVELRNLGAAQPLNLVSLQVTGPDAARYTLGVPSATTIPAGGTATVNVTFDPQGAGGLYQAWLDVLSNDQVDRHRRIDLRAMAAFPTLKGALLAFYPFDAEEDPLRDESGNERHLQLVGDAEPEYAIGEGHEGSGYRFFGTQRLISPVNTTPTATPLLTMGAWVKTSNIDGGLRKIIGADAGWSRVIGLDTRGAEGFSYTGFFGGGVTSNVFATPESYDDWTFIAAAYDQSTATMTIYVALYADDPESELIAVTQSTTFGSHQATTAIGSLRPDNNSEGWQGDIDNVFFYQKVLTQEEIQSIREGGVAFIMEENTPEPGSDFAITDVQRGDDVRITWQSLAGRTYIVEYSRDLAASGWENIATVTGQAGSTTFIDNDPTRLARPVSFYRVKLQP